MIPAPNIEPPPSLDPALAALVEALARAQARFDYGALLARGDDPCALPYMPASHPTSSETGR